jgi:hypothetical protein
MLFIDARLAAWWRPSPIRYIGAVERASGMDAPDFGQLVKLFGTLPAGPGRYSPPKMLEAVPTVVYGNPDPEHIATSYVERQNLTIRIGVSALYAAHERLQQETREPEGCARAALLLVQLRADSPDTQSDASDGGWSHGSGMGSY